MNIVILYGRLTQTPELHEGAGPTRAYLTIAAHQRLSSTDEPTEVSVTVYGKLARQCASGLVVGQEVSVQGRVGTRVVRLDSGEQAHVSNVVAKTVEFGRRLGALGHEDHPPPKQPTRT